MRAGWTVWVRGGDCARWVGSVHAGGECARCARGVDNVRAGWAMCARGEQCARVVGNVRAGWAMCVRGVKCARGV